MDFVIQWLCYLGAFLLGSLVAWLVAVLTVKPTSETEALSGARESGAP